MEQNIDEKEIIKQLFVSKEQVTERLSSLVNLSKDMIKIVEESGEVYFEDSFNFNNNEKIFLILLATYFSYKSGLKSSQNVNLSDLAEKLSVPNSTMPAPLNKLIEERLILKTEKGLYCINFENYKSIKGMLEKIKNKNANA